MLPTMASLTPSITATAPSAPSLLMQAASIPYDIITFNGGHRMDRDTLRLLAGEMPNEVQEG